ncbi:phenylalanine--tRNA ligase subunit beta [Candidatus Omnitrophota bacterium]
MKVSYSWLRDYVDVKLDPEKLAHLLTMAGVTVESCQKIGGDYLFEFEITANRPDCLSVIGIAREVAAILDKKLKIPAEIKHTPALKQKQRLPFDITLNDPELCPRYTARIIKDVEVKPSPEWLRERIISVGLRPVNNIVDITNFVLFETGQPLHAFDFDKIRGGIYVRRARKGETIITIDNVPRTCEENQLVIADEAGPIAIAGVMGGLETEVNDMTKNILLESAFFDPISIRRTARALGLGSESSYRFERRIDNDMVLRASERAAALIGEIAGDKIGPIADVGKKSTYSKNINFDLKKCNALLGVSIPKSKATHILKSLGFSAKETKSSLKVTVPSFRGDVKTDIDVTEEVARIYGYENIPLTLPRTVGNTTIKDFPALLTARIKEILTRAGLHEILTYTLINRDCIKDFGIDESEIVTVSNPLSIDQEIMRPAMLPAMLRVVRHNINRGAKGLSLFEIGKTYKEKQGLYDEETVLSVLLEGTKEASWKLREQSFDIFDVKGIFEKLTEELGVSGVVFKKGKTTALETSLTSFIEHKGETIGCLGMVAKKICANFDIEKKVLYGELYIRKILDKASLDKKYAPLSRYPSVTRDISLVLDKTTPSAAVITIIEEIGKLLVKNASLVDLYKGKQIPEGKRGLLYRIEYRSDERTLEDAEVDEVHSKIKSTLTDRLNVTFR